MIHWLRTIDYCFWFSFLTTYLCKFSSKNFFLHFLDNDDRMSWKRRNLSALVFLINLITKVNFLLLCHKSVWHHILLFIWSLSHFRKLLNYCYIKI